MAVSKQRISSPLEAGQSLLDANNLPPHLTGALDYVSKRLARKALHITLVVVRKDYQLPSSVPPTPTFPPTSTPATPDLPSCRGSPSLSSSKAAVAARFASMSPVAGLRQLVRRGTGASTTSTASCASTSTSTTSSSDNIPRSAATSPGFPPTLKTTTEALASPRRWPPTPTSTPLSPGPRTPMTPHTPCSITTTTTTSSSSSATNSRQQSPNAFGIRLVYTTPLGPKAEKVLRTTIGKAERRFRIGTGWLLPAAACGLNNADLVRRSLLQNEVLFSSEGLTLLGLDRLYTFKSALAAYARALLGGGKSPRSPAFNNHHDDAATPPWPPTTIARFIEDAVDELRRLVLANNGRQVSRAALHRSYDWIGVNAAALADVERMYRRAYGGRERAGAFEEVAPAPAPAPAAIEEPEREATRSANSRSGVRSPQQKQQRAGVVKIGTPPPPKNPTPVLKLNTNIATASPPKVVRPKPTKAPVAQQPPHPQLIDRYEDEKEFGELEIKIDDISWIAEDDDGENENDGDRTALPIQGMPFWNGLGASIDEMMLQPEPRQSQRIGPMTPNGYEDISPITRGEWGFLFAGDAWTKSKTAAVETC